jgi:hypothetical protein
VSDLATIAQELRKSHCDRGKDAGHACVGTCTITPAGIELSRKLCGSGDELIYQPMSWDPAVIAAKSTLDAAGLDFDALSPERQVEVIRVAARFLRDAKGTP